MSILGSRYSGEGATHELVREMDEGGYGWANDFGSWSAVGIFKRYSDGALFWSTDSGCSCSSAWDRTSDGDLEPLTVDSLSELQRSIDGLEYFDISEKHSFMQAAQAMVAGA